MQVELENINLIADMAKNIEFIKNELASTNSKRWFGVKELSEYLSYSRDRIYKLKEESFIENVHFYKRSGKILFDRVAIDSWVMRKETYHDTDKSQRQIVDNILSSITKI